MPAIEPFVIETQRKATSTDTFIAQTGRWKEGMVLVITTVAVTNMTSGIKVVDVGVRRSAGDIWFDSLAITSTQRYMKTVCPIVVPSDYRVIVRIVSPTSGDLYNINVFGYLIDPSMIDVSRLLTLMPGILPSK